MGGFACWPDPGGVNDQAAWLLDAFAILNSAEAQEKKNGGEG